jgi:predicted LPLAT superfamily acyltransferase
MACLREGDGYAVHFDCLAEEVVLPRKAREEVFATLAARFAQRIETLLAKAPYEWFNFFPFWGSR